MKNIITTLLLMAITISSAQTKISFSSGVLEQSNKLGLGIASTISVEQDVVGNAGISLDYSYAVLRGKDFQQTTLTVYNEFTVDRTLGLKPSVGIARQISGNIYPTFSFDMLARASDRVQIVLGWNPTPRGGFRDINTGWSMMSTIGLIYKI